MAALLRRTLVHLVHHASFILHHSSFIIHNSSFILSIDQGTSSTKTLIFDAEGLAVAKGAEPLRSYYSGEGFVEQDP
jgi:hypothetical protein